MENFESFDDDLDKIKEIFENNKFNELLNYTNISIPILQTILKEKNCFDDFFKQIEILEHVIIHSIDFDLMPLIVQRIIITSPYSTVELLLHKLKHDEILEEIINRISGLIFASASLNIIKLIMSYYENYEPQDCDFVEVFKRANNFLDVNFCTTEENNSENILNYLLTITKDINSYPQLANIACKTLSVTPSMFKKLAEKNLRFDKYTHDYVALNDYKYGYPGTLVIKHRPDKIAVEILRIIFEQGIPDKITRMLVYNEYIIYACKKASSDIINLILDYMEKEDKYFVDKVMNISYQNDTPLILILNNKKVTDYTIKRVYYLSKKLNNPNLARPQLPLPPKIIEKRETAILIKDKCCIL